MTILLKLCSFLYFFIFFDQKIRTVKKNSKKNPVLRKGFKRYDSWQFNLYGVELLIVLGKSIKSKNLIDKIVYY